MDAMMALKTGLQVVESLKASVEKDTKRTY